MARQVSPNTLGSLISTYVKRGTEEAEVRAHKALTILHARDQQVELLQRRVAELEGAAGRLEAEVPRLDLPPSPDDTIDFEDEVAGVMYCQEGEDNGTMSNFSSGDSNKDSCSTSFYLQRGTASGTEQHISRHLAADARNMAAPAFTGGDDRDWDLSNCSETQQAASEPSGQFEAFHRAERPTSSCVLPEGVHARCQQVIDELKRYNNQLQAELELVKDTSDQSTAEYSAILTRVQTMVSKLNPRKVKAKQASQGSQTPSCTTVYSDVEVQTAESQVKLVSMFSQTDEQVDHLELDYQRLQEENVQLKLKCDELEKQNEDLEQQYIKQNEQQMAQFEKLKRHKINNLLKLQNMWMHTNRKINLGVHLMLDKGQSQMSTKSTNDVFTQTEAVDEPEHDVDVPPQWLLEAALNRPPYGTKQTRTELKEVVDIVIKNLEVEKEKELTKVAQSTQVDMPDPREEQYRKQIALKDDQLMQQAQTIDQLYEKVRKHADKLRQLSHTASLELISQDIGNRVVDDVIKANVLRICHTVVNTYGLESNVPDASSRLEARKSDQELRHSSDDSPQAPERTFSKEDSFEDDIYVLKMRLKHIKENYVKAQTKIEEQEKEIENNYHYQDIFKMALNKLKEQMEGKEKQLAEAKLENETLAKQLLGTGEPEKKVSKQSENLRTQGVHGRLNAANQNIVNLNKTISTMRQEAELSHVTTMSLKSRIARSEASNQNRLLLIDNYKSKLQEFENKIAVVTTQNNTFMEVIESFKTQVYNLKSQVTKLSTQRNEYLDEVHKLKKTMNTEIMRAITDTHCRSAQGVAQKQLDEIRSYYNRQISMADQRINESERRVQQFSSTIEIFLEMVLRYGPPKLEAPSKISVQTDSKRETHDLVCSILKLTPSELQNLMEDTTTNAKEQNQKLLELTEHSKKLFSLEYFSEELAEFMFKVVLNRFEPNMVPIQCE